MDESSSSQLVVYYNCELCQVCGQKGHGNHFGAVTCRACAAFFRRIMTSKKTKLCTKQNRCEFFKNGWFNCKRCRLQRCWDVGMTDDHFQFNRDPFRLHTHSVPLLKNVPPSMNTFLGRSNFIVFTAPREPTTKNFIDVQFLLEKSTQLLLQGSETPYFNQNRLKKLAIGHQAIRGNIKKPIRFVTTVGKEEVFQGWEEDMMKVAKWLTYFDEFQMLPRHLKIDMLKSIWKVWTRLETAAVAANGRRRNICGMKDMMWDSEKEHLICIMKQVKLDLSWCSRYSVEQLKVFKDENDDKRAEDLIKMMMDLNPTDEEMSYMLAQLCFHHVTKRYEGEIAGVAERLQESLANDLHDYYVNELNMTNYIGRIAKMIKVNNHIQEDIYRGRSRAVVADVLEIFCWEFSHPEMFVDL